jgi:alpha-L-fucosidase 2
LVSAKKENGAVEEITIKASVTGEMKLKLPFKTFYIPGNKKAYTTTNGILKLMMKKGESVIIKNGFE